MSNFCSNCGTKLKDNADVCLNCGKLINEKQIKQKKVSIPGKGLSITSMIIGIVSLLMILGSVSEISDIYSYNQIEFIEDVFFCIATSIPGFIFAVVGINKSKSGFNISGIILNSISILLLMILVIIVVLYY